MKRSFAELVEYLYRETSFPHGCMLMTGTGIVPPNEFTLQPGDEIEITIPPMGILRNVVACSEPAGEAAEGFKPHANRTQ